MMLPQGQVWWLRSIAGGREFPIFVFSGDTDMGMTPSLSFTSADGNEMILAEMTGAEFSNGIKGAEACRQRVGKALDRDDLVLIHLVRREDENKPGQAFREFFRNYEAPRLTYTDLFTTGGEAEFVRREEAEVFLSHGGKIIKA